MEEKFSVFFERVINNPDSPVIINISSSGSNYSSAISIYNMLTSIADRLKISISGNCSDVATLIFSAVPASQRFAYHYSTMSISAISDEAYNSKNKELREIYSNSFNLDDEILNDIFENKSEFLITGNQFIQFNISGIVNHIDDIMR